MKGVPRHRVLLEDHSEEWKAEFETTRALLSEKLGENVLDIQHVGSTAIEGIKAKPMLDAAVLVKRMNNALHEVMKANGYIYYDEVAAGHYLFILRGENDVSLQHVHCYPETARSSFEEQVRFRDFLRGHVEYAREYEKLKLELCEKYSDDRESYTAGKRMFFDRINELAVLEKK